MNETEPSQGRRWLRWLGLGGLLILAGCATDNNRNATPASDPLLGGPPVSSRPVTGQPTSTGGSTGAIPLRPSTSPAALAPGGPSSLDSGGGLRIPGAGPATPPSAPPSAPNVWRGQGGPGGNVLLTTPEPAAPPAPPAPPPAEPARTNTGFGFFTGRQSDINPLLALLRQRGATFQRLETWGDEGQWKFSCAIPNRQNAAIRRTYEARAGDPMAAVRAVLDQIDKEQR